MNEPSDPFDAGLRVARAFDHYDLPYAIGGALAYGLWGVPRATIDVDVNVFVTQERLPEVFAALKSLSLPIDEEASTAANARDGMFSTHFGLYRIDIFTASIDFSWEAERTRALRRIGDQEVFFLSAEAVAVFKLLFFRPKDLVDLQRLLAVQGARLDAAYVREHLVDMMGEDNERVRKWDELVAAHL